MKLYHGKCFNNPCRSAHVWKLTLIYCKLLQMQFVVITNITLHCYINVMNRLCIEVKFNEISQELCRADSNNATIKEWISQMCFYTLPWWLMWTFDTSPGWLAAGRAFLQWFCSKRNMLHMCLVHLQYKIRTFMVESIPEEILKRKIMASAQPKTLKV